ncbi:MAG: TIM barrel protein [Dehalococcoidia bacterium]
MNPIYLQALSLHDIYGNSDDCIHAAADIAADLNIAGIDIEDRLLKSYEPVYLQELAHQIEGRGIGFGYCGVIVPFNEPVSSIAGEIERVKALIDAVPHLGIEAIRVPGNGVVDGQTLGFTFDAVRAKFRTICDYAAETGITVYLHNHNHGSTPSTGTQVLRMLDEIDSPALSYVLDTGQFQGSPGAGGFGSDQNAARPELYESIEMCAPRASITRTKFYFAAPGDEQWLDYPRIVRTLKNAGFNGPISIVYEPRAGRPSTEALPAAVRYLTELFE